MLSERLHLRDIRKTSTFRLTALLGAIFAASVVALLGLIYILSAHELTARTDRILRFSATALQSVSAEGLPKRIDSEVSRGTSGLNYYALQSAKGDLVAGNLKIASSFHFDSPMNIDAVSGVHGPLRILAVRAATGEAILIGRDITPVVDLRARIFQILVVSGIVIVFLVFAAGLLLSIAPLRRVRDLQETSREIAGGHFHKRMPVSPRGDELDLFAGTVNVMVEEMERVVAQVKSVTDAVAHDLRTPLAHVRGHLHRAIKLENADPRMVVIARSAMADLDLVLDRFAALLRIAELEARGRQAGFALVSLQPLLASVVELYEPLAEEAGVVLELGTVHDATIEADPKLLFEALSNLVDNAIKFTPSGGRVLLSLAARGTDVEIVVRDNGPGLRAEERKAALRRFYRGVDAAGIPGTGLGLSVVAAITHLHGFALDLDDASPGLLVRIRAKV